MDLNVLNSDDGGACVHPSVASQSFARVLWSKLVDFS